MRWTRSSRWWTSAWERIASAIRQAGRLDLGCGPPYKARPLSFRQRSEGSTGHEMLCALCLVHAAMLGQAPVSAAPPAAPTRAVAPLRPVEPDEARADGQPE